MINNAGLGGTASVTEMTDDQWSKVIDITRPAPSAASAPRDKKMMRRASAA